MPDFAQTLVDVFEDGLCVQSYVVDQALCDYEHIMDNLQALTDLLQSTVDAGRLKPITTATFLLDSWDYREFVDKLSPQKTQMTKDVIDNLQETYFALDGVEIYATESLCGTWYQKQ